MESFNLNINREIYSVEADESTPLLWVLRDHLGLVGTKYGCGIAQCGACTIHIDGEAIRSCVTPAFVAKDRKITTIEGLSSDLSHPIQKAWIEHDVPQCGYCQAGQMMSAAALIKENKNPSDADIDESMKGNICRCGTYPRIRKAIHSASKLSK